MLAIGTAAGILRKVEAVPEVGGGDVDPDMEEGMEVV